MFGLTALELARIQFGFTISFHIIFPALTIGLASYLTVLEGLWLWRKENVYRDLYQAAFHRPKACQIGDRRSNVWLVGSA
jgi:cytochrome bd-type quinol oxidase subunit 1